MLAFTAGIMVAVFVVVSIVSTNISISNYEQQYEDLVAQTSAVEDSNDEIRRYLDEDADMDEYIEDMARSKLDFAMPDERVYYVVPFLIVCIFAYLVNGDKSIYGAQEVRK